MAGRRAVIAGGAGALVLTALGYRAWDRGALGGTTGPGYAAWEEWRGHEVDGNRRPLRAAILAASPHDTQPWRFAVAADTRGRRASSGGLPSMPAARISAVCLARTSGLVKISSTAASSSRKPVTHSRKRLMPRLVNGRFVSSGHSSPRSAAMAWRTRYRSVGGMSHPNSCYRGTPAWFDNIGGASQFLGPPFTAPRPHSERTR
jgi:hypothetical protein